MNNVKKSSKLFNVKFILILINSIYIVYAATGLVKNKKIEMMAYENRVILAQLLIYSIKEDVVLAGSSSDFDFGEQQNLGKYTVTIDFSSPSGASEKITDILENYSNRFNHNKIVEFKYKSLIKEKEAIVYYSINFSFGSVNAP